MCYDERYVEITPVIRKKIEAAYIKIGSYHALAKELNFARGFSIKHMISDGKYINRARLDLIRAIIDGKKSE